MNRDAFRVTTINYLSSTFVIFTGVPIRAGSNKIKSARYFVTLKANLETLPVKPAIGQQWVISGRAEKEKVNQGDFYYYRKTYTSPDQVICTLPEDGEQFIKFIAKESIFKGIGESKARELWAAFGKEIYKIASDDNQKSRKRLKMLLSDLSINALFEGFKIYKNLAEANWLSQHKIPASIQQRLFKYHREESLTAIKSNPYLLAGLGMNFKSVDELAKQDFDLSTSDPRRLQCAVEVAIRQQIEQGHTYTNQPSIRPKVCELLGSNELATHALSQAFNTCLFIISPETGNYHPKAQILMELTVAKRLINLSKLTELFDEPANLAFSEAINDLAYSLTKMQTEAVVNSLNYGISTITGGAGTGKTTVLRTSLRAFDKLGYEIHAVALSGRAAMRLHESIGFKTFTIAAFLRQEPLNGDKPTILVIDEASMIDLPLMYRLITHIHPSVRVLMTGDPDQLPPIGCGKVLADIVDSKSIVNTTLNIIKRQKGSTGIPEYSKSVNKGIIPSSLSVFSIHFHETSASDIENVCTDLLNVSDLESKVIAPTKKLVTDINSKAQKLLNKEGKLLSFKFEGEECYLKMRLGDEILFTKNNYDLGVQNGTLGKLTSVTPSENGESFGEITTDTGAVIKITPFVLDTIELGYAITLHKAQGSQFERVIIALKKGRIVDRAWLYTAITRAEKELHIVGSKNYFELITKSVSHSEKRNSYLKNLLITQKTN